MNLTSIVGKAFKSRQKELLLHQQGAVALQHNVLQIYFNKDKIQSMEDVTIFQV